MRQNPLVVELIANFIDSLYLNSNYNVINLLYYYNLKNKESRGVHILIIVKIKIILLSNINYIKGVCC